MDLYLMQHGTAVEEATDPQRPLTQAGEGQVRGVAAFVARHGIVVDRVVHSGKLRAEQSARLLAGPLGCSRVDALPGMSPGDPVAPFAAAELDPGSAQRLAVVGHLPFLDRLASLLLAGDESARIVGFRNGGLVALTGVDDRGWTLAWALTPEFS